MDVWSTLERARSLHAERPALSDGALRLTWGELSERIRALACALRARGVAAGERVAILARNRLEYLEAYYAAAGLGAILCPLNVRLAPRELAAVLADAEARWLLVEGELAEAAEALDDPPAERRVWIDGIPARGRGLAWEELVLEGRLGARDFRPARVLPDDPAQLYYTSGTTGRPKGVVLTHRNVCVHALAVIAELGLCEDDVWAHVAPMFHLADAWASFALTWVGGRHVLLRRFEPEAALELFTRERVTLTNLVPTMLNRLVRHPRAGELWPPSLRLVLSGGAPIAPALVRELVGVLGCEYAQTYGMTETSPFLTLSLLSRRQRELPPEEQLVRRAKTGRPMLGVELRVVGADGFPVPPDARTVGEIVVRGPTVTPGYWRQPEATAAAFEDGWLRTGDLAILDEEGFVSIVDRAKDVILSGGETVYSIEVEAVLHEHPGVMEAAVHAVADPEWGEIVAAAIVPRPGASLDLEGLRAFCRGRLAAYKLPRRLELLAELPRTGSGKVAKRLLGGGRGGERAPERPTL